MIISMHLKILLKIRSLSPLITSEDKQDDKKGLISGRLSFRQKDTNLKEEGKWMPVSKL